MGRSQIGAHLASRPDVTISVIENDTYNTLGAADLAIVSSGTATVEAALIGVPMVVIYRVAATTAWVARRLVRTPFFAMVNLIAGKRVVPELIQDDFTPERVAQEAERLLGSAEARAEMRQQLGARARASGTSGGHRTGGRHYRRYDRGLTGANGPAGWVSVGLQNWPCTGRLSWCCRLSLLQETLWQLGGPSLVS